MLVRWCVATSYNLEEAEDDHDAIMAALTSTHAANDVATSKPPDHQFEVEFLQSTDKQGRLIKNKYASVFFRSSGIEGRICTENQFLQIFRGRPKVQS